MTIGIRMSKNEPKRFDGRGGYNINDTKTSHTAYMEEIKQQLEVLNELKDKINVILMLEGDKEKNPNNATIDNKKIINLLLYLHKKIRSKTPNLLLGEYNLSRWLALEIEVIKNKTSPQNTIEQINNIMKIKNIIEKQISVLETKI